MVLTVVAMPLVLMLGSGRHGGGPEPGGAAAAH